MTRVRVSTVVQATVGNVVLEAEFSGAAPPTGQEALGKAYLKWVGPSWTIVAREVLETLRKLGLDCISVTIQYQASVYAMASLETTP